MTQQFNPSRNNSSQRRRPPPVAAVQAADIPTQAAALQEFSTAGVLATCLNKTFGATLNSGAYKAYRDDTLAAAGSPSDPIERMFVEQLMVAHHRIGELHAQAAVADDPEVIERFNAAAVKLMAEFRKSSLALRDYRAPKATPNITVVKQQNVAAGDQQIALVDGTGHGPPSEKNISRSELTSNAPPALTHDQSINPISQSAPCGGWQAEPVAAGAHYHGGTTPFAGVSAAAPSVVPVHWPAQPGG